MRGLGLLLAAGWLGLSSPARAQTGDAELHELKREVESLRREVDALKAAGPAAARPAAEGPGLEWGGFGEMAYQNYGDRDQKGDPAGLRDQANLTRVSVDGVYRYNDWVKVKFELEALNAGVNALNPNSNGKSSAFDIEQAYADLAFSEPLGARAGLLVVPMGLVNEHHRPMDYVGTLRPSVETFIIPSTWRELGVGVFGKAGPLSYRSDVVTGLTAAANGTSQVNGFTGSQAIKGGRSLGALSLAKDGGWVARADVAPRKDVLAGASYYIGKAGQGLVPSEVPVTLWEAHASLAARGARLTALYAEGHLANAGEVNAAQLAFNPKFTDFAGNKFWGGYVTLEADALPLLRPGGCKHVDAFGPYFRFERYATQDRTSAGWAGNPANSRAEWTVGASLRPVKRLIVKAERQWLDNQARTGVHEWNLGLGYDF